MEQYGMFDALWRSFFSKKLYDDVVSYWEGTGLGYLFFLSLFISIVYTGINHTALSKLIDERAPEVIEQFQPITIENGQVSTRNNESFVVKIKDWNRPLLVVDPAGKLSFNAENKPFALLGKDQLLVTYDQKNQEVHSLEDVDFLKLDKSYVKSFVENVKRWAFLAIFPFMLVFTYLKFLLLALLYSLITSTLQKTLRVYIGYMEGLRLTCIAMTPSIILSTLLALTDASGGFMQIALLVGITLCYIYFGLTAYKQSVESL